MIVSILSLFSKIWKYTRFYHNGILKDSGEEVVKLKKKHYDNEDIKIKYFQSHTFFFLIPKHNFNNCFFFFVQIKSNL